MSKGWFIVLGSVLVTMASLLSHVRAHPYLAPSFGPPAGSPLIWSDDPTSYLDAPLPEAEAGRASLTDDPIESDQPGVEVGRASFSDESSAGAAPAAEYALPAGAMPVDLPDILATGLLDDCPEEKCGPCLWAGVDYLFWWVKHGPLTTPLVTTGSTADPVPGALGQPGTRILFGQTGEFDWGLFAGLRVYTGMWFNRDEQLGIEFVGLFLEKRSEIFDLNSNAAGVPLITRPVFSTRSGESTYLDAFPGRAAGGIAIGSSTRLWGAESNVRLNAWRGPVLAADMLLGARYLDLKENLKIQDEVRPLVANAVTFQGFPVAVGNRVLDFDEFSSRNRFYGPQVGGRLDWRYHNFIISGLGKVALGFNRERNQVTGATFLVTPQNTVQTAAGGILAQVTNLGDHDGTEFTVVPEAGINFIWEATSWLRLNFGYTFIYWAHVTRPGAQIDRAVNPGLVPTDIQFGFVVPPLRPIYVDQQSDYWAQGLNLGLELRY